MTSSPRLAVLYIHGVEADNDRFAETSIALSGPSVAPSRAPVPDSAAASQRT